MGLSHDFVVKYPKLFPHDRLMAEEGQGGGMDAKLKAANHNPTRR